MSAVTEDLGTGKVLRIAAILHGTVIDHIPAGRALKVLQILGLPDDNTASTISIAMHVRGEKQRRKDVVKVEGRELGQAEVDRIALIAPEATINIIRDHEVVKKSRVVLPDDIGGILRCSNSNCITNKTPPEPFRPRFRVVSRDPIQIKCYFCNRKQENIENNII